MSDILSTYPLWPVIGAFFAAAFVKGLTGLGFSTTCLALLTLSVGLKAALPLVLIPSLYSNLIVMRQAGHFKETVTRFWPLLIMTVPGIFFGLFILSWVTQDSATAVLGAVLITYGLFTWVTPHFEAPVAIRKPLAPVIGLLTGTVNGLTGSQVMPLLPFMLSLGLDRRRFTQAVNCSFSLSSIAMALGLAQYNILTGAALALSVLGIIPILIGVKAGAWCQSKVSEALFKRLVLICLIGLGASLLIKPILNAMGSS